MTDIGMREKGFHWIDMDMGRVGSVVLGCEE